MPTTNLSLTNLAVYRTSDDHASALFLDPLMIKIGFIVGPLASLWLNYGEGSPIAALMALVGTVLFSFSFTTRVRIDRDTVILSRRQLIFRGEQPRTFPSRGAFEADLTTAFEDDSDDPNAFVFRRAGNAYSEFGNDWRAANRETAIAWFNGQLARLGLLDRSYPSKESKS